MTPKQLRDLWDRFHRCVAKEDDAPVLGATYFFCPDGEGTPCVAALHLNATEALPPKLEKAFAKYTKVARGAVNYWY